MCETKQASPAGPNPDYVPPQTEDINWAHSIPAWINEGTDVNATSSDGKTILNGVVRSIFPMSDGSVRVIVEHKSDVMGSFARQYTPGALRMGHQPTAAFNAGVEQGSAQTGGTLRATMLKELREIISVKDAKVAMLESRVASRDAHIKSQDIKILERGRENDVLRQTNTVLESRVASRDMRIKMQDNKIAAQDLSIRSLSQDNLDLRVASSPLDDMKRLISEVRAKNTDLEAKNRDLLSRVTYNPTWHYGSVDFQISVTNWVIDTFDTNALDDKRERSFRFLEEAVELAQATRVLSPEDIFNTMHWVLNRPNGEVHAEIGGVMVTLAALSAAHGETMFACAREELQRIRSPGMSAKIRAKQKEKHALIRSWEPKESK